jgi:outer membrane beta-barrel protein
MKHMKLILIAGLVLGSMRALALKNSDPAAGGDTAQKIAPKKAVAKAVVAEPAQSSDEATPQPVKTTKKAKAAKAKASSAAAAPAKAGSLEDQLKALDTSNQAPAGANREKMYAVQARYLPLKWKNEFTIGGASNLTGDSFIRTNQIEAGYHLHFSDRWSAALSHAWVDNELKSEVDTVKTNNGALPDVPYSISRTDLTAEYNVFYGKFRWTAETVSYFDQYIALGAAQIEQNTGTSMGYVADIGFAFWMGKWGSTRLGLKDYYYKEDYRSGPLWTNNLHAHLDLGYLF